MNVSKNMCCFCNKSQPIQDIMTGETVCSVCGIVLTSSEFEQHASPAHTGTHSPLGQSNYTPSVVSKFSSGMRRAAKMSNDVDRQGLIASNHIKSCCAKLGLQSSIREQALLIFTKMRHKIHGGSMTAMSASSVYMACREYSIPRNMNEICREINVDMRSMRMMYKKMCIAYNTTLPVPTVEGFVTRQASTLNLPEKTVRKALRILKRLHDKNLTAGRKPALFAAYVIYRAAKDDGLSLTKKAVADAACISKPGLNLLLMLKWAI